MQKQWMKVSCAAAAALALAAPLSGYAMPRVADAGLVMTVTGEANRLLANDQAVITFTAEAQRPQAQDASDEIIKAGNAAIAALNAINAPAKKEKPLKSQPGVHGRRCASLFAT